jgi:RNA polymerase sigma factor (sigma-70 family)
MVLTDDPGEVTMPDDAWLAERFEDQRAHLRAVAYRMLGSVSEADDAVQEAWVRLSRSDARAVENLGGWLTTVVARLCLDMLRSRKTRREDPLEPHVPDPVVSRADDLDPEQQALLADSVGLALLVVLDTLDPAERLAFVLHDMFAVPFDEIAPMVGRSPTAARQLASAARRCQGSRTEPSGRSSQPGLCAISHGCPSGSMNTPEYPPQKVAAPGRPILAPAASASASTWSTPAGEPTLYASVMPPHPPGSVTTLSSASWLRPQSATIMPPA